MALARFQLGALMARAMGLIRRPSAAARPCSLVLSLLSPAMALLDPATSWAAETAAGVPQVAGQLSQFSDVLPTDWAYSALSSLVERYGCGAGYPNGAFAGGRPIARFEAAALLSACLERITESSDALKALLREFSAELAALDRKSTRLNSSHSSVSRMPSSA